MVSSPRQGPQETGTEPWLPTPAPPWRSLEGSVGAEGQRLVFGGTKIIPVPWCQEVASGLGLLVGRWAEAAAALTLGQVTDLSLASEQVPEEEQGIEHGGQAG